LTIAERKMIAMLIQQLLMLMCHQISSPFLKDVLELTLDSNVTTLSMGIDHASTTTESTFRLRGSDKWLNKLEAVQTPFADVGNNEIVPWDCEKLISLLSIIQTHFKLADLEAANIMCQQITKWFRVATTCMGNSCLWTGFDVSVFFNVRADSSHQQMLCTCNMEQTI